MQKSKKVINVSLSIVFGIALFLLIITASIGVPIYCRFFYYIQIKTLNLESTGFTYAEIKGAYDAVLNFLTLPGVPFSTGVLKYSQEGMSHFVDCKVLFNLNVITLFVSTFICTTVFTLHKTKVIALCKPKGFSVGFYSSILALAIPVILGVIVAIDFNSAFTVFHKIFFPGKDNWMFNPDTDQIIRILPQQFFMNCAIIIGVALITISVSIIIASVVIRKKHKCLVNKPSE